MHLYFVSLYQTTHFRVENLKIANFQNAPSPIFRGESSISFIVILSFNSVLKFVKFSGERMLLGQPSSRFKYMNTSSIKQIEEKIYFRT